MTVKQWTSALRVYADPRMVALFFLGFSSGLPRKLIYATLLFWLLDQGLSIGVVGLFSATALPYNLKPLWAPIIDRMPVPLLGRLLGLRRGWMLLLQVALVGAITAQALLDPGVSPWNAAVAAIVVGALSASQDVVIDAYRIEILRDDQQGAGAGAAVFGYNIATLVAGAGALLLADATGSWSGTYLIMAGCMGIGIITTLLVAEPDVARHEPPDRSTRWAIFASHFKDGVIGPFLDFLRRRGALLVLAFVVFYKAGDAFCGAQTSQFLYKGIGFSKTEIATIVKTYGVAAITVGVLVGGVMVRKMGFMKALWVAGLLQLASNLMFTAQAHVGNSTEFLTLTITVENLSGGLGTAAFVGYLSALCNKAYTATQYALLTSLSSMLHNVAATPTGYLAESMGWSTYFLATAGAAVPGLLLLWLLTHRGLSALPAQAAEPAAA